MGVTHMLDPQLLEILVCPKCKGDLEYRAEQNELVCHRSEEHTSELQSRENLVCRLLLEKKNCCGRWRTRTTASGGPSWPPVTARASGVTWPSSTTPSCTPARSNDPLPGSCPRTGRRSTR